RVCSEKTNNPLPVVRLLDSLPISRQPQPLATAIALIEPSHPVHLLTARSPSFTQCWPDRVRGRHARRARSGPCCVNPPRYVSKSIDRSSIQAIGLRMPSENAFEYPLTCFSSAILLNSDRRALESEQHGGESSGHLRRGSGRRG